MRRVVAVVDDNELTRVLAADALTELGYAPVAYTTCESALAAFARDVPAACLVDHVLPGMTGAELVGALRASADPRLRALPVIAFTASAEQKMLEAGANGVLRKPFKLAALAAALGDVLGPPIGDAPAPDAVAPPGEAPVAAPAARRAAAPPAPGLDAFAALHAKARARELDAPQLAAYRELRSELSRVLAAAQDATRGAVRRTALRVAASLPVTLERGDFSCHGVTSDVSDGGFSTVVNVGLAPGDEVAFGLASRGRPIRGRARVASAAAAGPGKDRLGLAFVDLAPVDREELEALVLETVLAAPGGSR